jgi:hypothetical protein
MTEGGIAEGLNTWPGSCPGYQTKKLKRDVVRPELITL